MVSMFVTFSQSPSSPEAPTPCPRRYSAISRRPSPKSAKPGHVHIARAVVRTFDRLTRGLETETNVLVVSVTALARRLLLLTRIPNVRRKHHRSQSRRLSRGDRPLKRTISSPRPSTRTTSRPTRARKELIKTITHLTFTPSCFWNAFSCCGRENAMLARQRLGS